MNEYILINRVPANYGRTDALKINDAWNLVTRRWKENQIFVSSYVFPNEGYLISESERIVSKGNVLFNNLKLVSVIIIKAENYESAVQLAKQCPHMEQFGTVEVRETLPRPL
ncbi:YciI family protein [Arcticibacter eurypsychrophilus]|uniref:YciI family protein n=1 Tax=Arcticibacter eurypsychrophilus TaxID=1434752 RepID=UPI00084DC483|nr:YciI family protein [Arcticibacter eurypsychrophilus]